MFSTFPVAWSPVCPVLSVTLAYISPFVVFSIGSSYSSHVFPPSTEYSNVYSLPSDVSTVVSIVTITLSFVGPLGSYVNVVLLVDKSAIFSVVALIILSSVAFVIFPALSSTSILK